MDDFEEVVPFFMPLEVERAWEIGDDVIAYWVYWEPNGDECMVGKVYRNGLIEEGDADWQAYFKLEELNPEMQLHDLGTSTTPPLEVLLVDRIHNKFYFVPLNKLQEALEKLGLWKGVIKW
mgnify:CR=1 FL=1